MFDAEVADAREFFFREDFADGVVTVEVCQMSECVVGKDVWLTVSSRPVQNVSIIHIHDVWMTHDHSRLRIDRLF